VIGAEQARLLTHREKIDLVFRPGFSTASAVTELSGRGIGMEIVREACIRMGGSVSISPRAGGGTTVTLQVPLSMSVVRALIVRDGGRLMAVAASQVLSVHLLRARAIITRDQGQAVRIGHEEAPLYHLPAAPARPSTKAKETAELSVLIIPYHGERVALAVDEMVSEDDLIVKPLPLLLQGVERLLGAIILPDGVPVPVLNLPPLLDHILSQGDVPVAPSPPPPAEQVVLVVDDSLTMRVALTQSLEHAGYTVLTARDGQEALEILRLYGLPQLVTLDIEMPRMDGLETLYAIRQMPGGATLPVFMLTSRSSQKHKRTAMKMGATRYFTKPYHDSEFICAVQEAIGSQQLSPLG
jgi:CheY-like chemotaxis protein